MREFNGWIILTIYESIFILIALKNFSSLQEVIASKETVYIKKLNGDKKISIDSGKHRAEVDLRDNGYFLFARTGFGRVILTREEIARCLPIRIGEHLFFSIINYANILIMKSLIIYQSIHNNNTEKIAEIMAKELGADLIKANKAQNLDVSKYDLIGFGSGIYFGRHHVSLLNLIKELKGLDNKRIFIFSTSGMGKSKFNDFDKNIEEELEKRSALVLDSFNTRGFSNYAFLKLFGGMNKNKPNEKDFKKAKEFIRKIINNLS